MAKSLFIAEKPSVAQEFAKALKEKMSRGDGFLESDSYVVTWCVGHLVTMSYPEVYDPKYKRWSLATLPFLPETFLYEVIPGVKKQFQIVSRLLNRKDVSCIYVCTDSGREGEYIYRLVEQMAGVHGKRRLRVWIDSQTEEEILRGIREAKDLSEYDNLSAAAYLRAKEDYLMGINFSRLLTLKYGQNISNFLHTRYTVLSVGRVMTCVLGMVVRREREIREFVKTPFYRVLAALNPGPGAFEAEWRVQEQSVWFGSPLLYKENGFKKKEDAQALIKALEQTQPFKAQVQSLERKKEKKNPPLLYNLAELQNECSKMFKISPDETLKIVQELYEKKMVTYPRTDARVLSSAVAKEIYKNISGLKSLSGLGDFAVQVLEEETYKNIAKTRYVNDKQITDHYAIIPTGQGLGSLKSLNSVKYGVYMTIVRRFLSIFFPPAVYEKVSVVCGLGREKLYASVKVLVEPGYMKVSGMGKKPADTLPGTAGQDEVFGGDSQNPEGDEDSQENKALLESIKKIKKGDMLDIGRIYIKEGETSPPKRYNSGSMILAMENAGQLIEDEELRAQIKGSGIGTSATRAEILKKLVTIKYLSLNKKTQVITPTQLGEMVFDVVDSSIHSLLEPKLTASWEKGLTYVAEGSITEEEYMVKLKHFIVSRTQGVLGLNNQYLVREKFNTAAHFYKKTSKKADKS